MVETDFKMFEKASYDLPDIRPFMELSLRGTKEIEKTYGPVFCTIFIKYALWFIDQKTGDKPEEEIKTLEQLKEFIISVADKYPTSFCAFTYAQIKTENILQGQTGAGTRVESLRISRNIAKEGDIKLKNFDVDNVMTQIRQTGVSLKIIPSEMGYKKNEDGSVDVMWLKCYLLDGCNLAFEEGILKRPNGGIRCGLAEGLCNLLKLLTNSEWDYNLLEFNKPYCKHRNYLI